MAGYKKLFLPFLGLLFTILISLPGCNNLQERTPANSYSPPASTELPISTRLSISHPPKLGETAELTYSVNVRDIAGLGQPKESLADSRAWVEFIWVNTQGSYLEAKYGLEVPANEVLVSGNVAWSGNALETPDVELTSTVQLPREGIWIIYGYFSGEGWKAPYKSRMAVAASLMAAAVVGTPEFSSGPLAYLGNFPYGEVAKPTPDDLNPVVMELDISRPPRVGEEVTITCRISSLYDVPDFTTELRFFRRTGERIPADSVLVKGFTKWDFDLKAGNPIEVSATVKFSEAGDWRIGAYGNSLQNIQNQYFGFADNLQMNVGSDKGSFGWQEQPVGNPTSPCSGTSTVTPPR